MSTSAIIRAVEAIAQVPQRKRLRRLRKPPALKAEVIVRRVNSQSKSKIAHDLGITRPTVTRILEESNIEQYLVSGQLQCARLIPKAVNVVSDRLDKGSENAAFKLLEGIGVLGGTQPSRGNQMPADIHLQQALQILVSPSKSSDSKELVSTGESLVTSELVDTKP